MKKKDLKHTSTKETFNVEKFIRWLIKRYLNGYHLSKNPCKHNNKKKGVNDGK